MRAIYTTAPLAITAPTLALPRSTRGGKLARSSILSAFSQEIAGTIEPMRALPINLVVSLAWFVPPVGAQVVPFFSGAATSFEPQISVVNSGAVLDAQAVVSSDMKYVTLNLRPQNTTLLALQAFTFQNGQSLGVVGLPPPAPAKNTIKSREEFMPNPTCADEIKTQADRWVLEREGMFRIGDAK